MTTPRPWSWKVKQGLLTLENVHGDDILTCDSTLGHPASDDAEHILRCINAHEAMLDALKMVASCFAPEDNDITAQTVRRGIELAEQGA